MRPVTLPAMMISNVQMLRFCRDLIPAAMAVAGRTRRRQISLIASSHVDAATGSVLVASAFSFPTTPEVAPATRGGVPRSAGGSGSGSGSGPSGGSVCSGGGAFGRTSPRLLPMKPGEVLTALKIFKNQDAPVVLPRGEYPEWVNRLAEKDVSLAQLRKMDVKDATDKQQMRFLKLSRRIEIRAKNEAAKAK